MDKNQPERGRQGGALRAVVTGASSLIARYLVPLLREEGHEPVLVSRTRPDYLSETDPQAWVRADLRDAGGHSQLHGSVDVLIHLAPLPLLERAVMTLDRSRLTRIIAFGTTSRLTKAESAVPAEQRMVREQAAAEDWLAGTSGVSWTLFRPTMIYDGEHDKNVALIARFIRRFGFFPLVGEAAGRRQPVHAADLARACCDVLSDGAAAGKTYTLVGGETLTYRAMVDRIFAGLGRKPRYLHVPPPLLRAGLTLARTAPRYRYLNAAMAERMNKDMVFDSTDAKQDFGYRPRGFKIREIGRWR